MEQSVKDRLNKAGINTVEAIERFSGIEDLYEKFLRTFCKDDHMQQIRDAIKNNDDQAGYDAAHTMKGVSGNLSIMGLYNLFDEQAQAFRHEPKKARKMMPKVEKEFSKTEKLLRELFPEEK